MRTRRSIPPLRQVPHRNVTLKVTVVTITGDPDVFICNRNTNPTHRDHTWKSATSGATATQLLQRGQRYPLLI